MRRYLSLLLLLASSLAAAGQPVIELQRDDRGRHYFSVTEGRGGELAVFVDSGGADVPAILGTQAARNGALIFTPRFPLQPGLAYRAEFRNGTTKTAKTFRLPAASTRPQTFVQHVYPSVQELPENQLKLYVHFSAPMSRGDVYESIHLLDQDGKEIEAPFLELGEELWNRDLTRFTLLFDPGRVKRDLVPNREVGAPLQPGRRYTLAIDAKLPDAEGRPLIASYKKEFRVVAADRTALDHRAWRIEAPQLAKRGPVSVLFPEPVDHGLGMRAITVRDAKGASVVGEVSLDQAERRWQFTPGEPWREGTYTLVIDSALEDLAGNRVGRLFDVDMAKPRAATTPVVTRTFAVAGPAQQ